MLHCALLDTCTHYMMLPLATLQYHWLYIAMEGFWTYIFMVGLHSSNSKQNKNPSAFSSDCENDLLHLGCVKIVASLENVSTALSHLPAILKHLNQVGCSCWELMRSVQMQVNQGLGLMRTIPIGRGIFYSLIE